MPSRNGAWRGAPAAGAGAGPADAGRRAPWSGAVPGLRCHRGRRSIGQGGRRHAHQARERGGVGDSEVGEHLAVYDDLGLTQTGDEPAVARAIGPGSGVDSLDPEATEVPLACPTIAVRVLERVHDRLVGGTEGAAPVAVITLSRLEDGATVLLAVDGALHPGHDELLS